MLNPIVHVNLPNTDLFDKESINIKKLKQEHLPDPALLQSAKNQIQALKQKYDQLADSRKTEEAVSRKSLNKYPFDQRCEVGLSASVLSLEPLATDISPVLGTFLLVR